MAATVQQVKSLPGIETIVGSDDALVTDALAEAAAQMHASTWGIRYDVGQKLLAAHLLMSGAKSGAHGAGGAVIRQKAGQVERTFAAPSASGPDAALQSTNYGQRYLALRRALMVSIPTAAVT